MTMQQAGGKPARAAEQTCRLARPRPSGAEPLISHNNDICIDWLKGKRLKRESGLGKYCRFFTPYTLSVVDFIESCNTF